MCLTPVIIILRIPYIIYDIEEFSQEIFIIEELLGNFAWECSMSKLRIIMNGKNYSY
jgi:hypothetical protein